MTEDAKTITAVLKDDRKIRDRFWEKVVAVLVIAMMVIGSIVVLQWWETRAIRTAAETTAADSAAVRKALDDANKGLKDAGKPTVSVPPTPSVPITPPTTTVTVTPAPPRQVTTAELEALIQPIVTDAIRTAKVTLTTVEIGQIARVAAPLVPRPADGKTPTPVQLQGYATVALASFCSTGRCEGEDGTDGAKGADGKDAPPVTDERLNELIRKMLIAACRDNGGQPDCIGAEGPMGPAGDRVVSFACNSEGTAIVLKIIRDGVEQELSVSAACVSSARRTKK